MALGPVRIPTLTQANPIVDAQGRMTTEFARRLNDIFGLLSNALNQIIDIPEIQQIIAQAQDTIRDSQLQSSYIDPASVLSASPTTITIASHTRYYGDGTSVMVAGGTANATATGDTDYVYYDDVDRSGGNVAYQVSTTQPVQMGARHVVGAVEIPTTGTVDGGDGPRPPGAVYPKKFQDDQP